MKAFICLFAEILSPGSGLAPCVGDAISRSLSRLKCLIAIKEANKGLIRGAQGVSDD